MGSPAIFSGKYTKLLTQNGLMNSDGSLNQYNGDKNYITYNNFENAATTGWSLFNTTINAGFIPIGSVNAGASTVTTFATTNTNPISGSNSLQAASSAAWTLGQGFISNVFTLEREDLNKLLTINFSYEVVSGAANANWGGVLGTQTFIVYIYNTTTSAWVQPSGYLSLNTSTGSGKFTGTFTSSSTVGQQYRIAILASRSSTGAVTINFDNFFVGYVAPAAITTGNLTESTSNVLTITGGSNAVVGSGTTVRVKEAAYFQNGYVNAVDYNYFQAKKRASDTDYSLISKFGVITFTGTNGTGSTVQGVNTAANYSSASIIGKIPHVSYSTVATAGSVAGYRTSSNTINIGGGFMYSTVFSISDTVAVASARQFVGLSNTLGQLNFAQTTNADPLRLVLTNFICLGYDGLAGDTNLKIFYNGPTAGSTQVIDLGASYSINPNDDTYQFVLYNYPGSDIVYYQVWGLATNIYAVGEIGSGLPYNVTMICQSVRTNSSSATSIKFEGSSLHYYMMG